MSFSNHFSIRYFPKSSVRVAVGKDDDVYCGGRYFKWLVCCYVYIEIICCLEWEWSFKFMCREISVYSLLECMAIVDIGGRREGDLVRFRCGVQYFGV